MKYVYKTPEGSFIVTIENFLFAFLPIAALLVLLLLLRQSVLRAAGVGLVLAVFADFIGFGGTAGQAAKACLQGAVHSLPIIVVFGTLFLYAWAEESGSLRRLRMLLAAADRAVFLCLVQPAVLCGAISYVMNRCKQRGIHHFVTSRI